MVRENFNRTNHKVPKFRESDDDTIDWHDKKEIQDIRRKSNKKSHKRRKDSDKW